MTYNSRNLEKCFSLIEDQMIYGGQKYAATSEKEATDILFDNYSYLWLLGTLSKYCHRFNNLERERDLLKILCYSYIIYLKRGFHLDRGGVDYTIDTNIEQKRDNFINFREDVRCYIEDEKKEYLDSDYCLNKLENLLVEKAKDGWYKITLIDICNVFLFTFSIWENKYANIEEDKRDKDTWNEKK